MVKMKALRATGLFLLLSLSTSYAFSQERQNISQAAGRLILFQKVDPQNPERLIEYGVLRIKLKSTGLNGMKIGAIKIPALISNTNDIEVLNPDIRKPIEFKVDVATATVLWALHRKGQSVAPQILVSDATWMPVPQEANINFEVFYFNNRDKKEKPFRD